MTETTTSGMKVFGLEAWYTSTGDFKSQFTNPVEFNGGIDYHKYTGDVSMYDTQAQVYETQYEYLFIKRA